MARKLAQQSLASWIFGGGSFLFLMGVFLFAPPELPEAKHRVLGLFAALCAAFLGYFLTGTIGIDGNTTLKPWGKFSIKAGGGFALFVLVLFWWDSGQSPSKVVKGVERTEELVRKLDQKVDEGNAETRKRIDQLMGLVAEGKVQPASRKMTDDEMWRETMQSVATKNGIAPEKLQQGIDLFIAAVKANPNADFMDLARVAFAEKRYAASAENAGHAAESSEEKLLDAEKLATLAQEEMKTRRSEVFNARKQQGLAFVANGQPEKAIEAYRLTLQVVKREQMPEAWAELQFLLGNAGSNWANISEGFAIKQRRQEAVKAYRLALEVITREALPQAWATTQNNLGFTLRDQAVASESSERARLLGEAVKAYQLALEVRTREALPQAWATTQNNLATALCDQAVASESGERARLLGEAVKAYRLALEIRTREALPQAWAETQDNLATALWAQAVAGEGGERTRLLGEAVKGYRLALEVYTREALPQDWAGTQNNLAIVLCDQAAASESGERARLLGEAVKAYRLALDVYTRKALPQDWAGTQDNLATALWNQAAGSEDSEKARLLGEAVKAYRLALEVYTREALPHDWAMTQNNLAIALRDQAAASEGGRKAQ